MSALIERLRNASGRIGETSTQAEAADTIESQAKRIAELESQLKVAVESLLDREEAVQIVGKKMIEADRKRLELEAERDALKVDAGRLFAVFEAACAVSSNEEHRVGAEGMRYGKGSLTWQVYEDLRLAIDAAIKEQQ